MPKLQIEAHGRFGNMLATALDKKGISLRDLAVATDYSYENMRKLVRGDAWPSEAHLKDLCKILSPHMSFAEAQQAATTDRIEHKHGSDGLKSLGRSSPRMSAFEELVPLLSDAESDMALSMIRGIVRDKRKKS
jgi:transcriptional regulator with XRE-family HTH domain